MSAAVVCGKRPRFEEIFGSMSPFSSTKRYRCSSFVPAPKANSHSFESKSTKMPTNSPIETESIHASKQKIEDLQDKSTSTSMPTNTMDGSSWVDIFVQEMMKASDVPDARSRAARILEAFEKTVLVTNSKASEKEQEIASLNENLQSLLKDNQILKRAVAIQHERSVEQEGKVKEVEQLKHAITRYQEQLKTLEMNNYALKLNLQRALDSIPMPSHVPPHVF